MANDKFFPLSVSHLVICVLLLFPLAHTQNIVGKSLIYIYIYICAQFMLSYVKIANVTLAWINFMWLRLAAANRDTVSAVFNSFPAVVSHCNWTRGLCPPARKHVGHLSESEDSVSIQHNR